MFTLLTLCAACLVNSAAVLAQDHPAANCSSLEEFLDDSQRCLDQYNVPFPLPEKSFLEGAPEMILSIMWLTDKTSSTICKPEHRENYLLASSCVHSVLRTCSGSGNTLYRILIPNQENARRLLDQDCDGIGEFNKTCALAQQNEIVRCGIRLQGPRGALKPCLRIWATRYCTSQSLQICGDRTSEMYIENLPVPYVCFNITDQELTECETDATNACPSASMCNSSNTCLDTKAQHECLKMAAAQKCGDFIASVYTDLLTPRLKGVCPSDVNSPSDRTLSKPCFIVLLLCILALNLY